MTSRLRFRLLPVALLPALAACGGDRPAADAAEAAPATVRVVRAVPAELPSLHEAGGLVAAKTTAVVASRLLAPVREVRVRPGDRVRAGQVLVTLDDRGLAAQARRAASGAGAAESAVRAAAADRGAAKAALDLAQATHQRIVTLHARRSATPQELDEAAAALHAAEAHAVAAAARERQAQQALEAARAGSDAAAVGASFAAVTAPFAGIVTEKLVEPGNMVSPGTPLVRVEDTSAFRLEVRLDASRATHAAPGAAVAVALDDGRVLDGRVAEVARAVDADARALLVKIDLPPVDGLRSGTFGRARLPGPARPALAIPETALRRQGQVTSAFVVEAGRARLRLVHAGETVNGRVEVLAGLAEGDAVVDRPPADLADGRRVAVEGGR